MGFPINGDLIPSVSGRAHLGIDGGTNVGAFSITSLRPFGNIHLVSGVFHDPLYGQSGVLRYNRQLPGFEISVDGGLTFNQIATGAGAVSSIGVINGADLTGNVDVTSTSGFIVITDNAGASPLSFNVDIHALSGLWGFPSNGFSNMPRCFSQTFSTATSWTVTHNLNSSNVSVSVFDDGVPHVAIIPDNIEITDANTVTVRFNVTQAGRVTIIAC